MRRNLVLGASLIALCLSGSGFAQAQEAYDWSGPYFGIKGGGAIDGSSSIGPTSDYDVDGFLIGIMGGYNFQQGNLVFGLDTDSAFSGIDGSGTCGFATCTTEIDYLGTTRARVGYAMDRFLPYATGGLASALVDGSLGPFNAKSKFHLGFAVGGGLEWAITDGWSARAEYLYIDLEDESHNFGVGRATIDVSDMHVIRAGVSMNTGWIWDSILGR
ncbi:MAG: porin family protein [Rhizobiales bacterium]|nr:porin family protein [Hyphomicrobiales bacterium]